DLHSIEPADMWLSGDEPNGAWIEYELDKVHKLHQMWVWNHNGTMESVLGFGIKDVTIEYSTNGTDYTTLGTTHEFARAPGTPGYAHNTTIDFNSAAAKYVRLTANSNWGGILDQYGLSEVRFFSIPVFAREPSPDSGTTDVAVDVTLGFRAGREADRHDVYLSTDEQAVIDGTALVDTVTETSYSASFDVGSTYYWRVDEVNDAETTTTWQGDIWNFSTHEFFVVDGFEDYNDYPPDEIWSTWVDGYGVSANGATVGYPAPNWGAGEHYVETTIVHGGDQSMPFFYDNTGTAAYSEATANIANLQVGQDWTKHGIQTLTLWIHGDMSNAAAGQLYVKINDTKVMYNGDLSVPIWKQWNVDLASLGINLSNITTLSIGVDGGGSGMLYVDDIALYRTAPPVVMVEPLDPPPGGIKGLVAYWKLDEASGLTAADSSGYGNDGTLMNMAGTEWTAGIVDGALRFDGNDQYIDFGSDESLWLTGEATISAWVKMEPANEDAYMGIAGKIVVDPSYNGFALVRHSSNVFRMWVGHDGDLENVSSDVTYNDTDWHHVVGVCQGGTNHLYVDGVKQAGEAAVELGNSGGYALIGKQYSDRDYRYWVGTIDDVRIYYRALSEQEISGL
ncbi:MAG: discoidin domain-containing protein, partial [Planctomycetes bacterium]|nr:discoidin domain-containing protein [Planctomycetota bacterium]